MSPGALTLIRSTPAVAESHIELQNSELVQSPWHLSEDGSPVWKDIEAFLGLSNQPRDLQSHPALIEELDDMSPRVAPIVVVASGIAMPTEEYEQRFQGIDLEQYRQRMPPDLFKAFVRHIGVIPGRSDLDVSLIATVPEE